MSSFNMKASRTRKYNADGSFIYNTMNATGLVNKYKNHNPRFDTNHKRIGDPKMKCNCTIAGCGKQCCLNYFLISDISQNIWEDSNKFNKGKNIVPGTRVKADAKEVGIIEDFFFPYSNTCIPLDDCDCSGNFPISVRLVLTSSSNSCVVKLTDVTKLTFEGPTIGTIEVTDGVKIVLENYSVLGSSRKGKPYRAPIAGYRKKLECCDPNMVKMCSEYCLIGFKGDAQNPNILTVGHNLYLIDGTYYGSIFSVSGDNFTVKFPLGDCNKKLRDYLRFATNNFTGRFLNADGSISISLNTKPNITQVLKECKTATNDIYKDPADRSCEVEGACYDKRIRSGMQPKKQLTCKKDCDQKCEKKYSFSYAQYNKNRAMNTYERGLEKNRKWDSVNNKYESCPTVFYKSSGNACVDCNDCSPNTCKPNQAKTVWKPNNKKFKKQGAVSAGSRLERLKLDTIRSANSKCKKGERCVTVDCEKIPNGTYFAGKPRFTGWMYNKNNKERVWGNRNMSYIRNRPLPLGIPQLTNKCRATRFIKGKNGWQPNSRGTLGVYQRTFPGQRSTAKNLRVVGYRDTCTNNCN